MRIVENAGKQKAIELFKETKRIEEDGGMFIRVSRFFCCTIFIYLHLQNYLFNFFIFI